MRDREKEGGGRERKQEFQDVTWSSLLTIQLSRPIGAIFSHIYRAIIMPVSGGTDLLPRVGIIGLGLLRSYLPHQQVITKCL